MAQPDWSKISDTSKMSDDESAKKIAELTIEVRELNKIINRQNAKLVELEGEPITTTKVKDSKKDK